LLHLERRSNSKVIVGKSQRYSAIYVASLACARNRSSARLALRRRIASINDLPIKDSERKYHWPLGRRPDDHPSLSDLGL
jgi:nuclear transport factor 2 (NTF2) superfamily protein